MNFQFKQFSSLARFLRSDHISYQEPITWSYLFPYSYPPPHPYPHPHPPSTPTPPPPPPSPMLLSKQFYLSKNDKQMLIEIYKFTDQFIDVRRLGQL